VRELNKVEIPILVLTGDKDMIVSLRAIRRWLTNCQGEKLEKRFFKGLYHEVFKESPNENVISEVQSFIAKYGL
jgi:alpha-beta hydrolase superfamily lysophospholipase